jgi:putative glutathione S-transferase
MARLVDGKWMETEPATEATRDGSFKRVDSSFRGSIGSNSHFPAVAGRYHLFVAYACPWASRTLVVRALKGLEDVISVSAAQIGLGGEGWTFDEGPRGEPGPWPLHRLYVEAVSDYTGNVTVPTLWDRETGKIVNNESSEIIRIFNSAFDHITGNRLDLYPEQLRAEIDRWNDYIYPDLNNGVYRAGLASRQDAYEESARGVFSALDRLETHLAHHRYLAGEYLTEADWRLFVTLVRFDLAYHGAFKCNLRRLEDYHELSNYLRELYQWPGISVLVRKHEIKAAYYALAAKYPTVPIGPDVDFDRQHDRDRLPGRGFWSTTVSGPMRVRPV